MMFKITRESIIPLFGFDFIGIIDRGTNLIEIKPTTLCNLKCGYCYAGSGSYKRNFEIEKEYLLEQIKRVVEFKDNKNIEAHVDPYGECLLYPDLVDVIKGMRGMDGISRISIQTNGCLLKKNTIDSLVTAGLDQVNITLNALNEDLAKKLACNEDYSVETIKNAITCSLERGLDVVITPVWFFKKNDEEIENIIKYYKQLKESSKQEENIRLGIQNYLVYKTGRKLPKVREREFGHFYKQLRTMEKRHATKLLLGPSDFNLHPAPLLSPTFIDKHDWEKDIIEVEILEKGRTDKEYLGKIDDWGVKVLSFTERELKRTEQIPSRDFKISKKHLITAYVKA
ncbi:MAG: radical SAM protein [Candidatus Hodarchaeota archaeon]